MTDTSLNFKDYFFSTYLIPYKDINSLSDIDEKMSKGRFPLVCDMSLNFYFPSENDFITTSISAQVVIQSFDAKNPIFTIKDTLDFDIGVFENNTFDDQTFNNIVNNKNGAYTKSNLLKMLRKDYSCSDFIEESKRLFLNEFKDCLISHIPNKSVDPSNPTIKSIDKIISSFTNMIDTVCGNFSNNKIDADFILMKLIPIEKENLYLILKEAQTVRLQNSLDTELKTSSRKLTKNKI